MSRKQSPWYQVSTVASGGSLPPQAPPSFEHNWANYYYKWRGLPAESPACLLLHWPLTVYRLLFILELVEKEVPNERRHLLVHLVGIEMEVDFLPIFGELALLFPNTDIELVLFGPGVIRIIQDASRQPDCLANQPTIFQYTAPEVSGGGTVRVSFSYEGPFWGIPTRPSQRNLIVARCPHWMQCRARGIHPLVRCHSGLRGWQNSFRITDYREISLRINVRLGLKENLIHALNGLRADLELTREEEQAIRDKLDYSYSHGLNPFMRLGPEYRQDGICGPQAVNGFEMVVTPGPTWE
ncbi:hypothetical protein BDZ97DRAFT_1819120 [Flammula alnicola]|nr:hypothetical protein BDZ97DRAFT_1819120 [Flammula alnicola]